MKKLIGLNNCSKELECLSSEFINVCRAIALLPPKDHGLLNIPITNKPQLMFETGFQEQFILYLELINIKYANEKKYLRKEAKEHFEKLAYDANLLGYKIIAVSAYRDYDYQNKLYNNYVKEYGLEYASKCSAPAGYSEHQTGLAVDVMGSNNDYNKFDQSKEFEWMKNNAHLYGFILRYPKNKENITGYKYEPWHYRYVGLSDAYKIYNNNLTLEEYINNK
jgi:LAS superfamily LD-carboxypeptidase LdcB